MPIMGRAALGEAPDVFGSVQVRRIRGQVEDFDPFRVVPNPVRNDLCVMVSGIVHDQEDLSVGIERHHALDEA